MANLQSNREAQADLTTPFLVQLPRKQSVRSLMRLPSGASKSSVAILQKSMHSLRDNLPASALNFFFLRRAGRYIGCTVMCPYCGDRPRRGMKNNRWRWLAMHEVVCPNKESQPQ
jgi:hypothetical protein